MSLLRFFKLLSNNDNEATYTEESGKVSIDTESTASTTNLNGDKAIRVVLTTAAPTNIELSSQTIVSGAPSGSTIGTLSTENGNPPYIYSITNDPDNKFDISGNNLITDGTVDDSITSTHNVTIRVTDDNANTFDKAFIITVIPAPTYSNDFSLSFNGVDERVTTNFNFGGRTQFTINTYMFRSSTTHRLDISQTNSSNNVRVKLIRNSNGTVISVIDGVNSAYTNNTTGWLMITSVFDGSQPVGSRMKMYADGVELTPTAPTNFPASVLSNTEPCYLGYDKGSNRFSTGNIDETSIWNTPLTQTQITELYNSGTPLDLSTHSQFANVLSWWRCGDLLSPPNMPDQVGTNNGTLENMDNSNKDTNIP